MLAPVAGNHINAGFLGSYQLWELSPLQPTWQTPHTPTAFTMNILHDQNIPNCRTVPRLSVGGDTQVMLSFYSDMWQLVRVPSAN